MRSRGSSSRRLNIGRFGTIKIQPATRAPSEGTATKDFVTAISWSQISLDAAYSGLASHRKRVFSDIWITRDTVQTGPPYRRYTRTRCL